MKRVLLYIVGLLILGTMAACQETSVNPGGDLSQRADVGDGGSGQGGSMARFSTVGTLLYAIAGTELAVIDVSKFEDPKEVGAVPVTGGIETVFPYKDKLFIGSMTGMFIYDNTNPRRPKYISEYRHFTSCDPVVVRDTLAFITLRSGSRCRGGRNQLDILNIKDIMYPRLMRSYSMKNPFGLGIDSNTLFVCDGDDGLKVYDVEDPMNIFRTAQQRNLNAYDVIPQNGHLIMVGDSGLYQYSYKGTDAPVLLSVIPVKK